jgi:protocatechuate 3,4-dioxygenase beta subunit
MAAVGSMPLRRTQVSLTATDNPQLRRSTTTDGDGRYEIGDLPAGRYQMTVTKAGYVTMQYGQRRPFEPGTPISVRDGETVSSIDFALPKGAVITVRLNDEFGEPVAGQTVEMQRFQWGEDGQRRLVGAGGGGTPFSGTDDRGEVRIFGLMPGEYVIGTRRGLTSGPGAGSDAAEGFANTFYPGTLSAMEAQPISVGIGQELNIQFALVASRLSRIRGTATDSQGRPAAGATINLVTQIGCGGMSSSTAGTVSPDGTFSVSGVPPGEHYLQFRQRLGLETESASVPISVGGDINGVAAILGLGTTVTGRVVYEGTRPSAGPQGWPPLLRVTAREACSSPLAGVSGGDVDPDDTFKITGATGRLFLTVPGLPATWTVKSVTLEGADITDVPLNLGDRKTVSDVRVTLTDKITQVHGFVADSKGQNLADYVVVIQSAEQKEPAIAARLVKAARPDTNGRFEVRGLRPGRYVATALDSMEQNRQFSPEFQKDLRRGAREFTIREGETVTVDLRLTTGL